MHHGRSSGEAQTAAFLAGRQSQSQRHVGFAGARVAQRQHAFLALDKLAASQLQPQRFVERRNGGKLEGLQTLDYGKASLLNLKSEVEACDSSFLGTWER